MSTEELSSRKAKKAARDADRKKSSKKRNREDMEIEEHNADGKDELKEDFISLAGGDETKIAKDASAKSKKRKTAHNVAGEAEEKAAPNEPSGPKSKKRRKSKPTPSATDGHGINTPAADSAEQVPDEPSATKPSKSRFILFIGNLPYTATDATITAHFKSIQPFTLRHRVDPKSKKSKGFAFLEFENYDRMKTCLKLYHHSTFDPDADGKESHNAGGVEEQKGGRKGKKDKSRRINVELTAGGGGKGEERKEKIKVKNAKLEEERKRRREAEEKEAVRREKKQRLKKTGANAAPAGKADNEDVQAARDGGAGGAMEGVHPARLARMKA